MALICPQCSQVKQDDTQFCRSCGYRFQGNEQTVDEGATIRPASLASVPADADPSETLKPQPPVSQSTPVMATPQSVAPPSYAQPAPAQSPFYSQPVQGGYAPQQPPQQGFGQAPQQAMYGQPPQQGRYGAPVPPTSSGASSLQRGFAGKGTPVHHQSWLIENKQIAPQTLSSAFIANLQKQNVMGVIVEPERLREHGTVLEERDYIKVRYGASSIFVYLAPMGQNLYISRTSTIQQPYSRVRMTVLIALAVLMLISLLFYAVINPDPTTSAFGFAEALKSFFFYAFFGLLFFFVIAALRSLVFLFTDNDFLAILRPNRLNDFSLDALSSIEQTTDKALRVTLQEAGLDADTIKLAHTSVPQQPLHRI
ncbi:MAG TPA: hypothetical protein VF458_13305 [Ktedonobacteraceae bacterium]